MVVGQRHGSVLNKVTLCCCFSISKLVSTVIITSQHMPSINQAISCMARELANSLFYYILYEKKNRKNLLVQRNQAGQHIKTMI